MKAENIELAVRLINQYNAVIRGIEDIISQNCGKIAVRFKEIGAFRAGVELEIPKDTAETILFNEKKRLEKELSDLGVEI